MPHSVRSFALALLAITLACYATSARSAEMPRLVKKDGHYGLMVDGVTVLPPKADIGTVAMYADGRVRIGAWGTEINPAADMIAWRQNGPLIVSQGQINPHTSDDSSND